MREKIRPIALVFLSIFLVLTNVTKVFAGPEDYRQCNDTETCEIGEFLFDDDYTPITTATCTLNTKDPQGNTFLNDVAMTGQTDGWYSYDVTTAGEDYGLYRSQICCTYLTEYICLDKSFEIATDSASLSDTQIADAVWDTTRADHTAVGSFGENLQNSSSVTVDEIWSHPQRSLTSFGTLISDVWSYSSRSINNVSSLVSSIWSNSDRSITSTDLAGDNELATKNQVENIDSTITNNTTINNTKLENLNQELSEISQQLENNRYFLELLINEPIIETFIEEGREVPNLQTKIKETKQIARALSSDIGILNKDIIALNTGWEDTSYQIALSEVSSASKVLGASTMPELEPDNINSKIAWLNTKWKNPILSNLSVQTTSALSNIDGINREIRSYGKTFISQQYLDIAGQHIEKLENMVGSEDDLNNRDTLFGYIAYLENMSDILIQLSLELDEIVDKWGLYTNSEKDLKLLRIKERFLAVNQIEGAETLLKKRVNDEMHRENLALTLKGLINSNLTFLAQDAGKISQNTWLEHGSIVFRSLVTNPSDTVAQNVQIKYYLPQEVSSEHIIKIEDNLKVQFDTEKNTLFVSGEVLLEPEETKTFVVEVTDIWKIPEEEIESIRKQTNTLFDSLKNTSYFAQGATMKADIEVNLDKIGILRENNQTPELKIKSHREAMLELNSAKSKLENLKTIVSSAGSIGTVFGFVGGVQAIAVWGLVLILIAGFVFLLIYLKMIVKSPINVQKIENDEGFEKKDKLKNEKKNLKQKEIKATKQEDISTLTLIKNIIQMRFGNKNKLENQLQNRKRPTIAITILALIGTLISVLIFILINKNLNSNDLISPIPESITDGFTQEHLEPKLVQKNIIDTNTKEKIAVAVSKEENRDSGMVLGKSTSQKDELLTENETLSLEKGKLVQVNIPSGYQAINLRVKPIQDSDLSGRLYVKQNVFILEEKDDWILIKTDNDSFDIPVIGWILESFVSEIP